jgi:hypothetical protein
MALNTRDSLAVTRFLRHALAVFSLSFALAGCDSFSLLDMLGPLTLTAATTTVARNGDPVALNVSGGTPPYSFSVAAVDLYARTSALPIGDVNVNNQAYEPGGAIGRIKIVVTDARGIDAQLFVTVVPGTPSLTIEYQATDIKLDWSYVDIAFIDEFLITRSVDGAPFGDFRRPGAGTVSTIDNTTSSGVTYSYRIYAVAGDIYSLPSQDATLP